ncbi:MAG: NUDIX hydrolase [Patescibacteria group bacterium]
MDQKEFYATLPRKRMGAGVLFFNEQGELLIVNPVYKDHWSIPGGVVDQDESPLTAVLREVREELGLKIQTASFVLIDYYAATDEKDENLQFIFYGGVLTAEQISQIKLAKDELSEYRFVDLVQELPLLSKKLSLRIPAALEAIEGKTAFYLENGIKK